MLKKLRSDLFAGAFTVAGLILAQTLPAQSAEGLQPTAGAATVSVTKVAKTCFADTVAVTGVLVPKEDIFVRPERDGLQISQILVEEGDRVTAGQGLIRLIQPDAPAGTAPTTLGAPVAGTVRRIAATIGTMASVRAEPLVQIISQGEIELQASAVPSQLAKLAPGQQAKISVVGLGDVTGQVRWRASSVDPMTQLAQIRVAIADSQRLHVGTFGRAVITVGQSCGVSVPMSAVLYGQDGAVVQAVRDNRVETRKVTIGLYSSSDAEIRQGVAEGDVIVSRAGAFLREGDRVRPVLTDAPMPAK
ncbi:MAG: efflux RND transporter periplasmic adaptor subunit [Xanthobacteraceae bacterium]